MGSKKKDLEIIYSLQWKDKPTNGGDKANIIGMYDIPATTLNWEIFKSYLVGNRCFFNNLYLFIRKYSL